MSLHPRTLLCGTCHISLHDPAICAQVLLELHVCIMKMLLSTKLLSKSKTSGEMGLGQTIQHVQNFISEALKTQQYILILIKMSAQLNQKNTCTLPHVGQSFAALNLGACASFLRR